MTISVVRPVIVLALGFSLCACGGGGSGGSSVASSKAASSIQASSSEEASSSVVSSIDAVSSAGSSENSSSASATKIVAKGDYSSDARPAFYAVLGDNAVDDQDCRPENPSDRLTEVFDNSLQRYAFAFHLTLNEDEDCPGKTKNRQRLEVKVYGDSPNELKGYNGETHYYRWKLFLPTDMKLTNKFTHVFQIISDQINTNPLITLTAFDVTKSGYQLELRYYDLSGAPNKLMRKTFSDLAGRWLDIRLKVLHSATGSATFQIVDAMTNAVLVPETTFNDVNLFREGTNFNRPKWGIYRDIENVSELLKDETVLMTDFCLSKEVGSC